MAVTSASGSSASSAFPEAVPFAASAEPVRDATRSARGGPSPGLGREDIRFCTAEPYG